MMRGFFSVTGTQSISSLFYLHFLFELVMDKMYVSHLIVTIFIPIYNLSLQNIICIHMKDMELRANSWIRTHI